MDGELPLRRTMKLTSAFDHLVCQGAGVSAFLGVTAAGVEQPASCSWTTERPGGASYLAPPRLSLEQLPGGGPGNRPAREENTE